MNSEVKSKMFSRNIGIISTDEQQLLLNSTVAVAGVGADGGLLTERLVRTGVGNIRLADPDAFDETNLNRQFGCDNETVGRNKAEVIAEIVKRINPDVNVATYPGVSEFNVREFIASSDAVVDEVDYGRLDISVLLHREARKQGKYVFLAVNIGWGANVFVFAPDGMTLEEYIGLPEGFTAEEMRDFVIPPEKFAPDVPQYMAPELITKIARGEIDIPSVSPSVALEAGMLATEIVLFLTKKKARCIVPSFVGIDLASCKARF